MVRISEPSYFVEALWRLRDGASFEELRLHLLALQDALIEEAGRRGQSGNRRGRAATTEARYTLWTTTRDALVELRSLGLLPRDAPVPSTKEELESSRSRAYRLSDQGRALLPFAERRHDDFAIFDRLLMLQFDAHEEIRKLWAHLGKKGRLALPSCDARLVDGDTASWLREVAAFLETVSWDGASLVAVAPSVMDHLKGRIERAPRVTAKLAAQWLDDAVGSAALGALGLDLGYVTVESIASLLSRYLVVGRTFHLPSFRGQVIYPTADISSDRDPPIVRPRFVDRREAILEALLSCLREMGPGQHTVWKVRSAVAYRLGVSDSAVDKVLTELRRTRAPGGLRLAFLNDFVGALPPSVHPLIVGHDVYYQIAVLLPRPEDKPDVKDAA